MMATRRMPDLYHARSKARPAALALLALALAGALACGGRSIRSTDDSDGAGGNDEPERPAPNHGNDTTNASSCTSLCDELSACAKLPDFCLACDKFEAVASASGCAKPFGDWLDCHAQADEDACSSGSFRCGQPANGFAVCILTYCDNHMSACYAI